MDVEQSYFKDKIIVFGHTPTRHFYAKKKGILLSELSGKEFCDELYICNISIISKCKCIEFLVRV